MPERQAQNDRASPLPANVLKLLAQLEAAKPSEGSSIRVGLIEQSENLLSPTTYPTLWADLHVQLADALLQSQENQQMHCMRAIRCYAAWNLPVPAGTRSWQDVQHWAVFAMYGS
jgi:hypothetical protein